MALTYKQSTLVRASIPVLREHGETITSVLYANMLRAHPELKPMFNPVNQATGRQPRALCAMILAFAANINDTSELIPRLERMCNKHCALNLQPAHYDILGTHLMEAFGLVLGASWTPQVKEAWTKAYRVLANMLIGREKQLYREFEVEGAGGRSSLGSGSRATSRGSGNSNSRSQTSQCPFSAWGKPAYREFRIDKKVAETNDMFSYYLTPVDLRPLPEFHPGQYVALRVKVGKGRNETTQLRQYSLSESPRPDYYRLTIRRDPGIMVGKGIEAMRLSPGVVSCLLADEKQAGDIVELSHPAGDFFLDMEEAGHTSTRPLVLISSSAGVAPMVSILNAVVASQPSRPVTWVQHSPAASGTAVSSPPAFSDHVRRVARSRQAFTTKFLRSKGTDYDHAIDSAHDTGVRADLEGMDRTELHLTHGAAEYFVCGPDAFVMETRAFLYESGVDKLRVKCEWQSTAGPGVYS